MHETEWLTVAAVFATVFAFMMIWINTRRAQIRRKNAKNIKMAYRRSTQRSGLNGT